MRIIKAELEDLPSILQLQYLAYQSEAELLGNYDIPPLKQTLFEIQAEYRQGVILKAVNEVGEITGSVRAHSKDGTLFIGKLIVRPDMQGRGIGTLLLAAVEQAMPHARYDLFTSSKSERNIRLYERVGYVRFQERQVSPGLVFIYLEKYAKTAAGCLNLRENDI